MARYMRNLASMTYHIVADVFAPEGVTLVERSWLTAICSTRLSTPRSADEAVRSVSTFCIECRRLQQATVNDALSRVEVGSFGGWGDKGQEYRPDRCDHPAGDGCMWCCQRCNLDLHRCPGCGTVSDHQDSVCDECATKGDQMILKEQPVKELRQRLLTIAKAVDLEYQENWINGLTKAEVLDKLQRVSNAFRK